MAVKWRGNRRETFGLPAEQPPVESPSAGKPRSWPHRERGLLTIPRCEIAIKNIAPAPGWVCKPGFNFHQLYVLALVQQNQGSHSSVALGPREAPGPGRKSDVKKAPGGSLQHIFHCLKPESGGLGGFAVGQ